MTSKKFLFFLVHPSKYHVFRNTINTLKEKGHVVDILITSKDVLEELVKNEGWNYTNIFPEGRKFRNISPYVSAAVNFFRTTTVPGYLDELSLILYQDAPVPRWNPEFINVPIE